MSVGRADGFALGYAGRRVSASVYFLSCCCYAKQPRSLTEVATNVHDFCDPIRSPDERTAVVFFSLADGQVTRPSGPSRRSILLLHGEVKRSMLSTAVDMTSFAFEALLLQSVRHHCLRS
jgi:hypothetical protein